MTKSKTILGISLILLFITFQTALAQKISPYLFGQNMWLTEGSEGRPGYIDQLWPKVKESGIQLIRIGGAGYDRNMPDLETLTSWVKSIKAIGAEPLLQVSKFKTPEESAKLVSYFNNTTTTKIKFWSIGNEPYHMDKYPIDSISNYIKRHASAMKAVDPDIKILVPDLAAYYGEVYDALLRSNANSVAGRDDNGNWYIDGINFHNYPNAKEYTRSDVIFYSVSKMRGMIMDLVEDLTHANEKYDRQGDDALVWGITEFNITYDNPDDLSASGIAVPSFINGQFWVDIFCMAMEYQAFTVTPWCIQESDRPRTYFGYIGGPPDFFPHSTFYHQKMLAENMEGQYIKILSENPYLKVFGSTSQDATTIVLMNQDNEKSFMVDLSEMNKENANPEIIKLTSVKKINASYKLQISPNSTMVLVFNTAGQKVSGMIYDLNMAMENKPPKNF